MKFLKSSIALVAIFSAFSANYAEAASFDARSKGAPAKAFSQSQARSTLNKFKATGGGGGTLETDYYCVWQDANGNIRYQQVNMLTVCINSFKVACDGGSCTLE